MTDQTISEGQCFAAALAMCGLSQRSAAHYFDISYSNVTKMCQDKRNIPDGIWNELIELWQGISSGAATTVMRDSSEDFGPVHAAAAFERLHVRAK